MPVPVHPEEFANLKSQIVISGGIRTAPYVYTAQTVTITSWAPANQSPAMQTMFGALRAIKPDLPQPQRSVTTLENPKCFNVLS